MKKRIYPLLAILLVLVVSLACGLFSPKSQPADQPPSVSSGQEPGCRGTRLDIISGSENKIYAANIQEWGCDHGIQAVFWWKGSVDIARILSDPAQYASYDAAMAANSLWHRLGDVDNVLRNEESVYISPIVFVVEQQTGIARELGWTGNTLELEQIVSAAENGVITFGITSATQSNSGNNMYMAILDYARKRAGYQDAPTLTEEMLGDPSVSEYVKRVLAQVHRSSASTGFLGEVFEKQYPELTGVFVYETIALEAIRNLEAQGVREDDLPRIYYVVDAVAEANAPLAMIGHPDLSDKQEEAFTELQTWLLGEDGQRMLFDQGARVRDLNSYPASEIERVFSPGTTGVDLDLVLMAAPIPRDPAIIRAAMNFYQSEWRRASCTAIVTDHSGSMNDVVEVRLESGQRIKTTGAEQLTEALQRLLDQDQAAQYYLQATPGDYLVVVPFTDEVVDWEVVEIQGNNPAVYREKWQEIAAIDFGGGTDMYTGIQTGLAYMQGNCTSEQLPAVIVMTDGMSDGSFRTMERAWEAYYGATGYRVPIYSITFGNADESQLGDIAELTLGDVFDGSQDLWTAFAKAKGNN
jgi:Ca-activated chloride channel family protein